MSDIVLQTQNLTKRYNKLVLNDVNLTVHKGDIYGFVGLNGAGKTTLMRIVAGLTPKTSGSFTLMGAKDDTPEIFSARRKMSVMVESAALYMNMTARQNVKNQCILLGKSCDKVDEYISRVGLDPNDKKKAKNFSLGMKQRLAIAVAMVGEPEFLLFDEPTNGLDPAGIVHIRNVLVDLNRNHGTTIMISSHILGELAKLATCYGFIDKGKLIKEITAEQLEKECSDSTRFRVSDKTATIKLLDQMHLDVICVGNEWVDVGGEVDGLDIAERLKAEGVTVYGFERVAGDLEEYFMKLIGG
jgi:ABC-2 type transport system ATP-binding protein